MFDNIPPINVRFDVDTSGLKAASTAAANVGSSIKSKFSSFGTGAGIAMGAGLIAGVAGAARSAAGYIGESIQKASDLNETISKTGAIFGTEAVAGLETWAESAADSFGQSKQQALEAASNFAIFGKGAGLTGANLNQFSTGLTQLAGDLRSFNGGTNEEAITAIGAALRGESEPIRRYGVLLDDATLKARALSMGIYEGTGTLTQQQRVLAAQAEIMAQTATAQGDFARTSGGLANTQTSLQSNMSNLKTEIGEAFLPVMLDLVKAFKDALPAIKDAVLPALQKLAANFKTDLLPAMKQLLPVIIGVLGTIGSNAAGFAQLVTTLGVLVPIVKGATMVIGLMNAVMNANPIGLVVLAIAALVAGIIYLATQTTFFQDTWASLSKAFTDFFNGVGKWAGEAWDNIMSFFGGIMDWFGGLGSGLYNVATQIWGAFVQGAMDVLFAFPSMVADVFSLIPGLSTIGDAMKQGIQSVKSGAVGMLTGSSQQTTVNNYNVSAQGLTVSQVQQDATRRSRLTSAVGGY